MRAVDGGAIGLLAQKIETLPRFLERGSVTATSIVLSDPAKPYAVVKILSADLEDRAANLNWHPGWRSFDAVARL